MKVSNARVVFAREFEADSISALAFRDGDATVEVSAERVAAVVREFSDGEIAKLVCEAKFGRYAEQERRFRELADAAVAEALRLRDENEE